ncbi:MAG: oxygen-independent coproporphyrinogen III oxidase, partial [Alphaproteobacteria bacterium]
WLAAVPAGEPVSLYVHLPFCRQLCWYCGCHTTITHKRAPVDRYLDALITEMAALARALGRRQPVARLHLGGGSPNALSLRQLERLFAALRAHFVLDSADEIAMELDPRLVTAAQAATLVRVGVNRVSLGVQDFEARVQLAINRVQPLEQVRKACALLRAAGILRIGFDLMYGLPHQTVETVTHTARLAASLGPHRIAVFGYAHVPWMKRHQSLLPEESLPDARMRWAQTRAIAAELESAGYIPIGFDHYARPEDGLAAALAQGRLRRNFQGFTDDPAAIVLGLGASAISQLPEGHVQNCVRIDDYRRRLGAGGLATARGMALSAEDRLRHQAIMELLCYQEADLAALSCAHGRDAGALDDALARLEILARDGLVTLSGRRVRIRPEARPLARWAAAAIDPLMAPLFSEKTGREAPRRHAMAV